MRIVFRAILPLLLLSGIAHADRDTIRVHEASGLLAIENSLAVSGIQRSGTTTQLLTINFKGETREFDLSRVEDIQFGATGGGRLFHVEVADEKGRKAFPRTLFTRYEKGVFQAKPEGAAQPFPLDAAKVLLLVPLDKTPPSVAEAVAAAKEGMVAMSPGKGASSAPSPVETPPAETVIRTIENAEEVTRIHEENVRRANRKAVAYGIAGGAIALWILIRLGMLLKKK